jgi:transglutaminase-like putative cysteine protease
MSGELLVRHDTEVAYSSQVAFAQHLAYLEPLAGPGQEVLSCKLEIDPPPARLARDRDVFGNARSYFALARPHEELRVRALSRVRLAPRFDRLDVGASQPWEAVRLALHYAAGAPFQPASEFCFDSPFVRRDPALLEYAAPSFGAGVTVLAGALELMHRIHADFRYVSGSTTVATPVLEAFRARTGVCQDFSQVMIGCLRSLGLAARYVSGYLHTQPRFAAAPKTGADRPERAPGVIGADASHAWVSVYCPLLGWVEFDPTNDAIPGTGHVRLAAGRDYGDVAPLRGVVQGGGEHELKVAVAVTAA